MLNKVKLPLKKFFSSVYIDRFSRYIQKKTKQGFLRGYFILCFIIVYTVIIRCSVISTVDTYKLYAQLSL